MAIKKIVGQVSLRRQPASLLKERAGRTGTEPVSAGGRAAVGCGSSIGISTARRKRAGLEKRHMRGFAAYLTQLIIISTITSCLKSMFKLNYVCIQNVSKN